MATPCGSVTCGSGSWARAAEGRRSCSRSLGDRSSAGRTASREGDVMSAPVNPQVIGEHIRRLRSDRGLSVRAFAAQTGFSPSFISQLENGQVSPSLGSLQKIAETLGVTLGEFFAATETGEERLILRREDRRRLDSTWTDAHIEALGPMARSRRMEPVLVIFGPGGKSGQHPH